MTALPTTGRDAAAFPLALGGCLLAVSVLTAVVVGVATPAASITSLEAVGQWLGWFCGVGLLVAINVALAATVVARRGTPPRFATALVVATLTFYLAAFALSLVRGALVDAWVTQQPGAMRSIMTWLPFASLLQMLLVAALSLALAWQLGGRGAVPVAWTPRARRALGTVVAFGACVGLLPLQGRLMAMLDLVSLPTLQLGLPFLAVTLGVAHALLWALWPVRAGSGVWPAFVSSALVGPLLLAFAWLSQFILGRIEQPMLISAVASALLLACPLVAWAGCRAAGNRQRRATVA
ncbi:MAG: hypothetical protein ACYC42_04985 [Lysobacter sp.]